MYGETIEVSNRLAEFRSFHTFRLALFINNIINPSFNALDLNKYIQDY